MEYVDLSYIFGLSTMFFGIMTIFFYKKGKLLYKLVALLMWTIALECVKDFIFVRLGLYNVFHYWNIMSAIDMVAVPMYAFVLIELVSPGRLKLSKIIRYELPFIILPVLYIATGYDWIFYILIGWTALFGTYYLIWTMINIPRYNWHLMERYSYTENINLNWLRNILFTFYLILVLWTLDCLIINQNIEWLYMACNLILWMVISVFLFRHESVIDELSDPSAEAVELKPDDSLAYRIEMLFKKDKIYLNPNLRLSEVAAAVGSNRTYLSNYFNRIACSTFYDYVNNYRVNYAANLMRESDASIKEIAEQSGFNSSTSFIRVFSKIKGCTPSVFRQTAYNNCDD